MTLDQSSPDYRCFNDIIQMRQQFLGMRDWGHPRYPVYDYPQRLCLLSDMNRVYILREVGNIRKFLEIEDEINKMPGKSASPQDKCIYDMAKWVDDAIKSMTQSKPERPQVSLSLLVYGKDYAEKCVNYAFKSMMTEGNLPALCKEKSVILYAQIDNTAKEIFEAAPIVARMKELGVRFEYAIIPEELITQVDMATVYWLVGAAATLGLEYARATYSAFHHCYPDIIYSDRFFTELLRLTKSSPSILSPAHRSDETVLLPSLKPYENENQISVPSADLVALGLNAVHMCHWPSIVNNRPGMWAYPQTHSLIWETNLYAHFNCPHLNAIWLDPEVIAKSPQRFYISLDSELDFLCEGEDYYIPQEDDDLYLVEFSNQGKQKVEDVYVDSGGYAVHFWRLSTNRDNFKFFVRGMKLKINHALRPIRENTLEETNTMQEKVYLINTIQSKDPGVGTTLSRPRTHLNRIYGFTQKA